jgi:hypothetical protein
MMNNIAQEILIIYMYAILIIEYRQQSILYGYHNVHLTAILK